MVTLNARQSEFFLNCAELIVVVISLILVFFIVNVILFILYLSISRRTKPVGSVKYAQDQARGLGTVKSLNAPQQLSQLALRRDYAKKIDPCRMLVWLGRRIVQNIVIGSSQYTLLFGRPVQTGQVLFEFKFTTAQSDFGSQCYKVYEKKFAFY